MAGYDERNVLSLDILLVDGQIVTPQRPLLSSLDSTFA